jgi:hypothetical protein
MGEKTKIAGIEVEVASEERCAEADFMVCATKEQFDKNPSLFVPGTKDGYHCMVCEKELIMAPSGQRIAALGNSRQICIECVMKLKQDDSPKNILQVCDTYEQEI